MSGLHVSVATPITVFPMEEMTAKNSINLQLLLKEQNFYPSIFKHDPNCFPLPEWFATRTQNAKPILTAYLFWLDTASRQYWAALRQDLQSEAHLSQTLAQSQAQWQQGRAPLKERQRLMNTKIRPTKTRNYRKMLKHLRRPKNKEKILSPLGDFEPSNLPIWQPYPQSTLLQRWRCWAESPKRFITYSLSWKEVKVWITSIILACEVSFKISHHFVIRFPKERDAK